MVSYSNTAGHYEAVHSTYFTGSHLIHLVKHSIFNMFLVISMQIKWEEEKKSDEKMTKCFSAMGY